MSVPTRQAILSAYRTILRMSNPMFDGRRPRSSTLSGPFAEEVQTLFRAHRAETNPSTIKDLYRQASDVATMLTSSIVHAEAVFDGGWCLKNVCILVFLLKFCLTTLRG